MDILELYLKELGIPEKSYMNYAPLVYEHVKNETHFFYNVEQIKYSVFYITLDVSSATPEDFKKYKDIKEYLQLIHYKSNEHASIYYLTLDTMQEKDYNALDLYNHWANTSVKEFERLQNKYYAWTKEHPEQFNSHLKKIMDYYGNLYKLDLSDQLFIPVRNTINHDFASDFDDLPF